MLWDGFACGCCVSKSPLSLLGVGQYLQRPTGPGITVGLGFSGALGDADARLGVRDLKGTHLPQQAAMYKKEAAFFTLDLALLVTGGARRELREADDLFE